MPKKRNERCLAWAILRAMSQENVEALRWLYQKWAKGDLWALRKIADPNIEWEWTAGMASISGEPRIYRGLDEIGATTASGLRLGISTG